MPFTDHHYELYMNRKVWVPTLASGVISGIVMSPENVVLSNSVGFWVEEVWENGVIARKAKTISNTGVLEVYDDEPLWNSCPTCGAKPGYTCDMNALVELPVEEGEDHHYNRKGRVLAHARMKLQGEKQAIRQQRKDLKKGPHPLVDPQVRGYL